MSALVISVTNFLLKLVVGTIVLFIAQRINPFLFLNNWVVFTTAIIIAVVGVITDLYVLPRLGNGRSVLLDFIINTFLIWLVPNVWNQIPVTLSAALICSAVIALLEYSTHVFMLRSERLMDRARSRVR